MLKASYSYLISLFVFKLAVGAIILLIAWDTLSITNHAAMSVSTIMVLSFLPAAFSKPLFTFVKTYSSKVILGSCFLLSAILILVDRYCISQSLIFELYVTNFILWIILFLIDVICERWYVAISKQLNNNQCQKLSGISTSMAQLGVILGPLLVVISKRLGENLSYITICTCFLLAALFAINSQSAPQAVNTQSQPAKLAPHALLYVLGFALIWPTLTIFNICIPLLAKSSAYNSIHIAGILDALIGCGMATIGFLYAKLNRFLTLQIRNTIALAALIISALATYVLSTHFILISISIFFLGLSFGYLRTQMRMKLSEKFSVQQAGSIVAKANMFSALFIIIYAAIFYINNRYINPNHLSIALPLSFFVFALIFILTTFTEIKWRDGRLNWGSG